MGWARGMILVEGRSQLASREGQKRIGPLGGSQHPLFSIRELVPGGVVSS